MRLVAFDLDDTLMKCGKDYVAAKQQFAESVAQQSNLTSEKALEEFERVDHKNVEKHGLSMDRFPESMKTAYQSLVENPTAEDIQHVSDIGYNVFKSVEEYAERGFMDGAEDILSQLRDREFELHLITAGDKQVQQKKIDGLGLERFFTETHVVPMGTKDEKLSELVEKTDYTREEVYLVGNSTSSDIDAAITAGVQGVYIPTYEWRPSEDDEYYQEHELVSIYQSLSDFAEDCPDTLFTATSTKQLA